jgi:hypothetical protein
MIVDNHFTRQYNPEDNSEHHIIISFNIVNVRPMPAEICYNPNTSGVHTNKA